MKNNIGIYIHIPFCVKKCAYCDFCSFENADADFRDKYVDALCREIDSYGEILSGRTIDSIFFGGGTPSLLNENQILRIFGRLREYRISDGCEISMEINPKTADKNKLSFLREAGINRLSIGMQSAVDSELSLLSRIHTRADFEKTYFSARDVGFDNINVDIMTALPSQKRSDVMKTLEYLSYISPEHISAYMLKVEDNTPFAGMKLDLPGDDEAAEMYLSVCDFLEKRGYRHYEISNFAKNGRECKHNLKYWQAEEYIGIGVAAHSYIKPYRYEHNRDINSYIDGSFIPEREYIGRHEETEEYIMLSLRLDRGIVFSDFFRNFGYGIENKSLPYMKKIADEGYAVLDADRFVLTDKGMCISNTIICDLLPDDE